MRDWSECGCSLRLHHHYSNLVLAPLVLVSISSSGRFHNRDNIGFLTEAGSNQSTGPRHKQAHVRPLSTGQVAHATNECVNEPSAVVSCVDVILHTRF